MTSILWQILQILLVAALAPLVTGWVRLVKARLGARKGASVIQPYRDLYRLLQKEAVVAEGTSWVYRAAPYVTVAAVWLAAAIVPTFTTDLALTPAADLIALVALLGLARFWTALAAIDAGTAFGGIGASREMLIASLAEPAMLMVAFLVCLLSGSTALGRVAEFVLAGRVGLSVSAGLALAALVMVAIAENGRIPIDNPATHLELTMVHEAMILDYSGRHLAAMEFAGQMRLALYIALILCLFLPWGMVGSGAGIGLAAAGLGLFVAKTFGVATVLGLFESATAKMRVFRYADFLGGALLLGLLATLFQYVSQAL
jgi:formate hydrogenlyase subunit 4